MSMGQRLNMIEAVLDNIRVALDQEILKLAAAATTPQITDSSYHVFWQRIESYGPRIEQALTQLKSLGHALDLRRQNLWNLSRERRFSGRQSVSDQDRHLGQVHKKALEVLRRFEALRNRGRTPTDADLVKGLNRLSKEADGIVKGLDSQAFVRQLNDALVPGQGAGFAGSSLTTIALLVSLIWLYIKRGPKKD